MPADQITPTRLRRLAEVQPDHGMVISLFLNLDPAQFATAPARPTAVTSLITEAGRRAEQIEGLDHDERAALRNDVERARCALDAALADTGGARAVAVYCCSPADFLEVVRLPAPVESRVVIDRSPYVQPLAATGPADRWCVVLVDRRSARILVGDAHHLEEVLRLDDSVSGQHDQGGWSQRNFERGIEKEVQDHLDHVADELFATHRRSPLHHLVVVAPDELAPEFERRLHAYLQERIAGRLTLDVENTTVPEARDAMAAIVETTEERREREALDRLAEVLGRAGRGAAGLGNTLHALNEQRVDVLLLAERLEAAGCWCPTCGLLTVDPGTCPADGTPLQEREDIVSAAVERATLQSAEVLVVRRHDDLEGLAGIGAILRY